MVVYCLNKKNVVNKITINEHNLNGIVDFYFFLIFC